MIWPVLALQFHERHEPAEVFGQGVGQEERFGEELIVARGQGERDGLLAQVDPDDAERDRAGAAEGAEDLAEDRVVFGADRLGSQDDDGEADDQATRPLLRQGGKRPLTAIASRVRKRR